MSARQDAGFDPDRPDLVEARACPDACACAESGRGRCVPSAHRSRLTIFELGRRPRPEMLRRLSPSLRRLAHSCRSFSYFCVSRASSSSARSSFSISSHDCRIVGRRSDFRFLWLDFRVQLFLKGDDLLDRPRGRNPAPRPSFLRRLRWRPHSTMTMPSSIPATARFRRCSAVRCRWD